MKNSLAKVCYLFLLVATSCTNREQTQFKDPNSVKLILSKGRSMSSDSVEKPKTVPAGKPQLIPSYTTTSKPTHVNLHPAGPPTVIRAGKPTVVVPGSDTFALPKTFPARGTVVSAGRPGVVTAKDMASKDHNPASFSFFKVLQGLPSSMVTSIVQDKSANLWFGTAGGGICCYDGKSFTSFTEKEGLPSNLILCMRMDRQGAIWFGTGGNGLGRYDGKHFKVFDESNGFIGDNVLSITEDSHGLMWFGTRSGLCRYDGKSFTNFTTKEGLAGNVVSSILEDRHGMLWIGTRGGLSCYDGKSFANYTDKQGLPLSRINCILEDHLGHFWFGTDGEGASYYDGKSFTNFSVKQGLSGNVVMNLYEDQKGNIWFGSNGRGLCAYDGKTFTTFSTAQGLPNNSIWSIYEDRSGSLWLGTGGGGVCRYDGKYFNSFADQEGFENVDVTQLCEEASGKLWLSTFGKGLFCYDETSFTSFMDKETYMDNIWCLLQDGTGRFRLGTNGSGVFYFDGRSLTALTDEEGLIGNCVLCMLKDRQGDLWFGTTKGVSRYDGKTFTQFTVKEGLPNDQILSLLEDRSGNIWFGTHGGGLCRYDGKKMTVFTSEEGLAGNTVNCLLEDPFGAIWAGTTEDGVSRYNGAGFMNFTEKNGLVNNTVLSLLLDAKKNIWLGTRKGLSRIDAKKLEALDKSKGEYSPVSRALFYNYGYNDGFLGSNCNRKAVFQDSKGRIWWGADVLTCYTPDQDRADTSAPIVHLSEIKLFGETISWAQLGSVCSADSGKEVVKGHIKDTVLANGVLLKDIYFDGITNWYSLPEHLSLPYHNNNLTFAFIGVHMQSHNHIKYQYMLEGMDQGWSSVTPATEAPYGNLPPGDYTFKVKAMNQSGNWSRALEFPFVVRPPWWQTWWFRILTVCVLLFSVWYYIKSREKKLQADKRKLERTVAERTAEVVEEKKIVEAQKEVIEEKHKEITDSINYAERIQRSLLASEALLDENLGNYFVFFQPKDVVSGDFYWAAKLNTGSFLLLVADSTGHGVPGAIMSILNISSVEKAVEAQGLNEPAEILNYTRKKIIQTLKKDGSAEGGKDGMDCSLVRFDAGKSEFTYAAANNYILLVRGNDLLELAPNKMPVGKHDKQDQSFTQHVVATQPGDVVYMITDGFADQFGGPKGKKFMHRQLKALLISIGGLPVSEQKQKIADALKAWKGDAEQVDDITVVGVRIGG